MYVALTRAKQSLFVPEVLLAKIMNRKPTERKETEKTIRIKTKKKKTTDLDGPLVKPKVKKKLPE